MVERWRGKRPDEIEKEPPVENPLPSGQSDDVGGQTSDAPSSSNRVGDDLGDNMDDNITPSNVGDDL